MNDDPVAAGQAPVDLIARIRAGRGHEESVAGLLAEYGQHVSRSPGTLRFEVYRDADDSSRFVVLERYADQAAFEHHLADPANAEFNGAIAGMVTGASELQFLRS
ncbi:antibiotic biosynthesis monooxygenase [Herbiconiux moechotypicola]|uniref:ABM domain-containing protein n=1 Tax=Herbiconiux moechotypicola TaxID=637393 RepID=A0ABN3DQ36_9MICO|nr:putative quinol monooxygenase [Herbiconiux moechotypicola]MCS5731708.1 antibiotic biosynthesis monooxygenase [Herbiconiux moechotypicola]